MEFTPGSRSVKVHNKLGKPYRVQVPKMLVVSENQAYGTLDLVACPEFVSFWTRLEDECKVYADPTLDWKTLLSDGRFRVKIDEKTHVFDSASNVVYDYQTYLNKFVTCILEVKSVYKFKGMCGISCRTHQIKVHEKQCLL